MKYLFLFCLLLCLVPNRLTSQPRQIGSWDEITAKSVVNDLAVDNNGVIWGATTGGLFSFSNGQFQQQLGKIDGLYELSASVISYLPSINRLYLGYEDGTIDIVNPESQEVSTLSDIRRTEQFNTKGVNSFLAIGDSLLVATDFGVVIYNLNNNLVISSATKFGSLNRGTAVNDIVIRGDSVFCATQFGIAVADLNSDLVFDDNWRLYDQDDGLPDASVITLSVFDNRVFAGSQDQGLFQLDNNSWQAVTSVPSSTITSLVTNGMDQLAVISERRVYMVNQELERINTIRLNRGVPITSLAFLEDGETRVGTTGIGLGIVEGNNITPQLPNGPLINLFSEIIYESGYLYAGTSEQFITGDPLNSSKGYQIFDGENWTAYTSAVTEELTQPAFSNAFELALTENALWVGSWGRGVVRHQLDENQISKYYNENSSLEGTRADNKFVVVPGLAADNNDELWATSFLSTIPLYKYDDASEEWVSFNKSSAVFASDHYFKLFIDSFDQKWIALRNEAEDGVGLLLFDENNIDDPADDIGYRLTAEFDEGNLPNPTINDFVQDLNDEVWIATARGVARFIFPELIMEPNAFRERRAQWLINADTSATSPFLLRDIYATALAVNDANEKWIGTLNDGVWKVNAEGSEILEHFTEENSPLLNNAINDITIDKETGTVYIATTNGISTLVDTPVEPEASLDRLHVYPNPYSYQRNSEGVFIEGLPESSEITVLTVDGMLVDRFQAQGGRVKWSGLSYKGGQVATGVYMIIATNNSNNEKAVGKLVIVR